jgi:hypothetical protein
VAQDSAEADNERVRDLLVALASGEQAKDFDFASREPLLSGQTRYRDEEGPQGSLESL